MASEPSLRGELQLAPGELPDGQASDFHTGFPPRSGFDVGSLQFELQNLAHGLLGGCGMLWGLCGERARSQVVSAGLRKDWSGQTQLGIYGAKMSQGAFDKDPFACALQ